MAVDHAGHGDRSVGLDRPVERTRRCPLHRADVVDPIPVNGDSTLLNDIVVFIHRDDERITNQYFHSGLILNGEAGTGYFSKILKSSRSPNPDGLNDLNVLN